MSQTQLPESAPSFSSVSCSTPTPMHPLVKAACWTVIGTGVLVAGHVVADGHLVQQVQAVFSEAEQAVTPSPLTEFCGQYPANPMCVPPGSGR